MENIYDRLQFIRHEEVFPTREDAYNYVINYQIMGNYPTIEDPTKNMPTLFGEPMVLLYESGDNTKGPNVILAIGSVGNGIPDNKNRTFFIDTHKTEEEIDALNIRIDEIKSLIGIGINPIDSDTIDMSAEFHTSGTTISGDVKIADYRIVDGKANYNIIQKEGNKGIYAFVDMDYDPETLAIKLNVNGVTKEIQLPADQHVVRGWYDPREESIIFKLADDSQVKVLVSKLIEEWTVLPDGQTINGYDISGQTVNFTPVVFTKTHVGSKATEHEGIYEWQDVLEADIRLADHITDNILHKDRTGRYLYVKGTADNIKYKDGLTVKDALDNTSANISSSAGNLIYRRPDGIYATAMIGYNSAENKLIYTYSDSETGRIKEQEIKLNGVKLLEDITYDPIKEAIVIRYVDSQGEYQRVEIPVSDIIEEWDIENEGHNIILDKFRSEGKGKDILTADARIHVGDNNILQDVNHELYVKGISENIKYDVTGDTTVKDVLDGLSLSAETLNAKINQEAERAKDAEIEINNKIGNGFDIRNTVRDEIDALKGKIDNVSANTALKLSDVINEDNSINVETRNDEFDNPTVKVIKTNLSSEVEDGKANIIKLNADGIYAGVDLIYEFNEEIGTNQLIFKTTNGTKTYDLKTNSVVDKIYYDSNREAIIIEYTVNGHRMPDVVIPVGDLINEWRVWDGHEGAVQLEKTRIPSGTSEQDILKASVVISDHDDNIVINDNGALYVSNSGITSNKNEIDSLKERLSTDEENIGIIETAISNEITRAISAETVLQTNDNRIEHLLEDEINRSTNKDNELQNQLSNIESALENEINRSENVDNQLRSDLNTEITRATTQESYLLHLISDEVENRISGDSINSNAIVSEETRAREAETRLEATINSEISRAQNAEGDLREAITAETLRAQEADNELYQRISDEVVERSNGDASLSAAIITEISRATGAENTISQTLNTEVERSTQEDARLNSLITAETASREAADNELEEEIRKLVLTFDDTNSIDFTKTTGNVVTADVKLQSGNNIIKVGEGLYATVSLSYDGARNTIKLITSNGEQEAIQLNTVGSLIDGMEYNADERALVIKYHDAAGNPLQISFPVNQLFNDWEVDNPSEKSAVELTKTSPSEPDDPDKLKARILITDDHDGDGKPDQGSNNLIEIRNNGLYVDGSFIDSYTGDSECLKREVKAVERAIFGNQQINECGDGFVYVAPDGTYYINSANTVNNATYILDLSIKRLSSYTEDIDNRLIIVSGKTDCNAEELKVVENDFLGMPLLHACGEGDSYRPNQGTFYIFSGTSFNDTDIILDREIKRTNDDVDILNQKVNIISGDVECLESTVDAMNAITFGSAYTMPVCGEDAAYPVYDGCVISAATSFYEADKLLDQAVCELMGKSTVAGSDTPSNHTSIEKIDDLDHINVDTRLSHGSLNGMSDDDLVITDASGAYIDPTRTEFTDTNALRIISISGESADSPYNGIYLSNIWDCGLYYDETEDADAIEAANEAGYNTNYRTDNAPSASNINYMNNVRQNDI